MGVFLVACCLGVALSPAPALAVSSGELQSQLDAAVKKYDELSAQTDKMASALGKTEEQLAETQEKIDQTDQDIAQKQSELDARQVELSKVVTDSYKHQSSLLEILLGSRSMEQLVSNIYYADKVASYQQQVISEAKKTHDELLSLRDDLESQKDTLQKVADEQRQQSQDYEASQAKQEAYVNSLSADVQEALAQEMAEREAAEQAEEAAKQESAAKDGQSTEQSEQGNQGEAPAAQNDPAQQIAPTSAQPVSADVGDNVLVGVFFSSDTDLTDTIYASKDGFTFNRISTAFKQRSSNHSYAYGHYCIGCPSIIYRNGYFWMLSGWNRCDGKIWVTISYSKDLVNWTHPEGAALMSGTHGIPVDAAPSSGRGFDLTAPEWFLDSDGSLYIVVSCGYLGLYHGHAGDDHMQVYIAKVNELSASGTPSGGHSLPQNLRFSTGTAHKLSLNGDGADRIDSCIYQEGGSYYLVTKKNGLTMEIYKSASVMGDDWRLVNGKATYSWEGPSVVRFGGQYLMYVDHVVGLTATGTSVAVSGSMEASGGWQIKPVQFLWDGKPHVARHGTVICINKEAQPEAYRAVTALM